MQNLFQSTNTYALLGHPKTHKSLNWVIILIASITLLFSNSEDAHAQATTYIIRSGDTLAVIAYRHGTSVDAIKKANDLTSDLIYPGDLLLLPGLPVPAQIVPPPPTPTPSNPKPEPSLPSYSRCSSDFYIVRRGDTLYGIAVRANSSIARIKRCNNLHSNTIWAGQILVGVYVPQLKSPPTSCGLLNARCQRRSNMDSPTVSTAMENSPQTIENNRILN